MNKVDDGIYAGAVASLKVMQDGEVTELNKRLDKMSATLDLVNAALPLIRSAHAQPDKGDRRNTAAGPLVSSLERHVI